MNTTDNSNYWREMEDETAFQRVRCYFITHPKKTGHAVINVAYPKDGAGRLRVYVVDRFGETGTCTRGQAGGFGYDKLTAALSGLSVDGVKFSDHCGTDETSARLLARMERADTDEAREKVCKAARRQGYSFANGNTSCYREPGLDILRVLGYSVIQGV